MIWISTHNISPHYILSHLVAMLMPMDRTTLLHAKSTVSLCLLSTITN